MLKFLFALLFGLILATLISLVIRGCTTTPQERIEENTEFIYLEKHRYLIYYFNKNSALVHSEECEICKKNK